MVYSASEWPPVDQLHIRQWCLLPMVCTNALFSTQNTMQVYWYSLLRFFDFVNESRCIRVGLRTKTFKLEIQFAKSDLVIYSE